MPELLAPEGLTDHERELIALSNTDLHERLYGLISERRGETLRDQDVDNLYWLIGELFERYAPELEWGERVRRVSENDLDADLELKDTLDNMTQRYRASAITPARTQRLGKP
jgi:hypothetical protein